MFRASSQRLWDALKPKLKEKATQASKTLRRWSVRFFCRHLPLATGWFCYQLTVATAKKLWWTLDQVTNLRFLVTAALVVLVVQELRPHSTTDALVHVVWTEARGESRDGQEAVVWTVFNRLKAQKVYWGRHDVESVVYNRRGEKNELCEYDGVCITPSLRGFRYTAEWFDLAVLVIDTRLKIALGFTDPTGGAHSYATQEVFVKSRYHQRLCGVVDIGNHRFGVDPETGDCPSALAPKYGEPPLPRPNA